jgi:hypothetical protein
LFFLHFFLFFHLDLQDRESCGTTHTHVTARRVQHERYQCFSLFFCCCCIIDDRKKEIKVPGMNNNM